MSLIDDFANNNLVQSVRNRFVPLTGGNNPPNPGSARADALAPPQPRPAPSQGVFNQPGQPEIPTLTHPLRDPSMATQPGQGIADAARQRGVPPMPAAPNPRDVFTAQPGEGLARATGQVMDDFSATLRWADQEANGNLAKSGQQITTPGSQPSFLERNGLLEGQRNLPPAGNPPAAPNPRAAFNQQPGQAFAEASGMTNPPPGGPDPYAERMARQAERSRIAAGPTGVQAGSLDEAMRAATLRNGAQPGEALAARIASGPPPGSVAAGGPGGGGGGGPIPPGGPVPPGAGGPGWYSRATQALSAGAEGFVPPGGGMVAKAAGATLGAAGWVAKKASPYVAPLIEGYEVAKVATDPNSTKADVVEQAGIGTARVGSAIIGGSMGTTLGAMTGPAAPIAAPVLGIAGGVAGYFGGDKLINTLRTAFGLPESTPYQRTDAREQVPARMAQERLAAERRAMGIEEAAQAAANDKAANAVLADPAKSQALVDAFKPQPKAAPGAPGAPAAAPQGGNTTVAAAANAAQGPAPQFQQLQAEQAASPISFTTMGGGQAPQVFYKDGRMETLQAGQPVPDDVAQFNARHQALTAMMNGQPVPQGAAPAAPAGGAAPPPGQLSPFQQTVYQSATQKGVDPTHALVFTALESADNPNAANATSSARGPLQLLGANRKAYGLPPNPTDTQQEVDKGLDFVRDNTANLTKNLGRAPSMTEAYMGHLFGAQGAANILKADQNAPLQQVVAAYDPKNAAAIVKNNRFNGMTVGQAMAALDAKVSNAAAQFGGGAANAPAQAQAPMTGSRAVQDPVHVIEGMNQYTAMPTGGGSMQKVPKTVADFARNAGDMNGGVQKYLGNAVQGLDYQNNPTAGKVEEERVKAAGQQAVAGTTGTAHVAGAQVAAAGQVRSAQIAADAGSKNYITAGGGVDPQTMMPKPQQVFNTKTGTFVDQTPKTYAPPTADAIAMLKKQSQLAPQFDEIYGPGAAAKILGK